MNRLIVILLCVCGVVVCAFVAYLGYQQNLAAEKTKDSPPTVSCRELLEKIPDGLLRVSLTEFRAGKHYADYDDDEDGQWDRVFVPLFPADTEKLGINYRATIVCFSDTPDQQALFNKINGAEIEAQYWFTSSKLDNHSYNRLAEKYSSMDFDRSVVLYSGYPVSAVTTGSYIFWGASVGAILSALVLGWQSISLLVAGIRSESRYDDSEEEVVTNRAGLPTGDEKTEAELDHFST